MDGFKAYKYYLAIKLHFSNPKYNVFERRGRLKGSYDTYCMRPDYNLFERVASRYNEPQYIRYIASNFMYRNPNVIYDDTDGESNYKEYLRRKESITKIFGDDISKIIDTKKNDRDLFQMYLRNKITIETAVILDKFNGFVSKLREKESNVLLWGDELLRIEKAGGFVKYDPTKVIKHYMELQEN